MSLQLPLPLRACYTVATLYLTHCTQCSLYTFTTAILTITCRVEHPGRLTIRPPVCITAHNHCASSLYAISVRHHCIYCTHHCTDHCTLTTVLITVHIPACHCPPSALYSPHARYPNLPSPSYPANEVQSKLGLNTPRRGLFWTMFVLSFREKSDNCKIRSTSTCS
jgi:hypothetical protein